MAKVVYAPLKGSTPGKKPSSVTKKQVTGAAGQIMTVYTLNADGGTFGADLSYAFGRNVAKVRSTNKDPKGLNGRVPPKG